MLDRFPTAQTFPQREVDLLLDVFDELAMLVTADPANGGGHHPRVLANEGIEVAAALGQIGTHDRRGQRGNALRRSDSAEMLAGVASGVFPPG